MHDAWSPAQALPALGAEVAALMEAHGVPGVAVGLLVDGAEHYLCRGMTSLEHPLPVDADTLFQVGSTTKSVTASALARLAEQGALDLDAPVRTYLPDLRLADPDVAARVTVKHLLLHTAGWDGDLFADTGWGDDALARYVTLLAGQPQVTPLGAVWSYNNAAYCLAGRVIEVVTGQTYEAAARALVLDPLGMRRSTFTPHEAMVRRFAVGHVVKATATETARPWPIPRSARPAGGLISSACEQLAYARFHLGDGRAAGGARVLRADTLQRMQTPHVEAADGERMGLGWMLQEVAGARIVTHGGDTNGQSAAFWMAPERRFAFTCLTNADTGRRLHTALSRWVRERLLGLVEPPPPPFAAQPAQLAAFAGRYEAAGSGDALTVAVTGDALAVTLTRGPGHAALSENAPEPLPTVRAALETPDRARVADRPFAGAALELLRDADGAPAWLRLGRVFTRR